MDEKKYGKRRVLFYWLALATSYGLPIGYYGIKLGFFQTSEATTTIVMPIMIFAFLGIIRIGMDIPVWVASWQPSFFKGLIKAVPVLLLFIGLISVGVLLQYAIKNQPTLPFASYYEAVITLFGSMSAGSILNAFHLKYKELDMLNKGFVLGTIRK